jgi:hypothetical protein
MSQETLGRCGRPRLLGGVITALAVAMGVSVLVSAASQQPAARQQAAPAAPQAPPTPRATAPLDLTGYWVSVVTEDWRWRMLTPAKGDAPGVPLSLEGRKAADAWDLAKDNAAGNQCKAYGAGGITRIPGRIHITWENDNTLHFDYDAGKQTRIVHMLSGPGIGGGLVAEALASKPAQSSLQGYSVGRWQLRNEGAPTLNEETAASAARGRGAGAPQKGSLKVVTTALRSGYYRKNGLTYGDNAMVTEYYDRHDDFGTAWFTVLTVLDDPKYLASPFVTTTHFKREPDGSKWNPQPCETLPPTINFPSKGEGVG